MKIVSRFQLCVVTQTVVSKKYSTCQLFQYIFLGRVLSRRISIKLSLMSGWEWLISKKVLLALKYWRFFGTCLKITIVCYTNTVRDYCLILLMTRFTHSLFLYCAISPMHTFLQHLVYTILNSFSQKKQARKVSSIFLFMRKATLFWKAKDSKK